MPLLCPQCCNPFEPTLPLPKAPGAEVVCPACGSGFALEQGATVGAEDGPRRIGRFELLGVVGAGAFGTVYRARDAELDRVVAVKVPRAGELAGRAERDRFLREARSVAQLSHPSIVPVHEVGQQEGVPFLVSEFVSGTTLADVLTARRLSFGEAARLVAAVAEALQYAHDRGVVHRDVKPSNVMLDEAGRPWLMDFGLARRDAGEVTMTLEGQLLGTPAYMSPEQARGEAHAVDGRSDVYSLGVVLYELLTGELPFRGNTRMLLHQVLHDEPRPPRRLNDCVPRDLETVCLRAMAKGPGRRYPRAADLADDLGRFLKGEPIRARPVGRLERVRKWARRRPAAAALVIVSGAALLLVLGGLTAGTLVIADRQQKTEDALRREQQTAEQLRGALTREQEALRGERRAAYFHRITQADRPALTLFSPDGGRLAVLPTAVWPAQAEGSIWDVGSRKKVCSIHGAFAAAAFSADGKLLAAADNTAQGASVFVWGAGSGQLRHTLPHAGAQLAFSPADGPARLATFDQEAGLRVWDAAEGRAAFQVAGPAYGLLGGFSPDGLYVATTAFPDRLSTVWSAVTGKPAFRLRGGLLVGFTADAAGALVLMPDGLKSWGLTDQAPPRALPPHEDGRDIAVGAAAKRVAVARGRDVLLFDAESRRVLHTLRGHTRPVCCLAFSADGARLATAADDPTALDGAGEVLLWDVAAGLRLGAIPSSAAEQVWQLTFRRDSLALAVMSRPRGPALAPVPERGADSGARARMFDLTGRELFTVPVPGIGRAWQAALGPTLLVVVPSGVLAYDDATGRPVWSAPAKTGRPLVSPDGTGVALLKLGKGERPKGEVLLLDPATGRERHRLPLPEQPQGAAWAPGGGRLAVWHGRRLALWDAANGRPLHSLPTGFQVMWAAWDRPGRRLAAAGWARDGVKVWDAETGTELLTLPGPAEGGGRPDGPLGFSPDGASLVQGRAGHVSAWGAASPATPAEGRASAWRLGQAEEALRLEEHAEGEAARAAARAGAAFHLRQLRGVRFERVGDYLRRGRQYAFLNQWDEAAADFGRAVDGGVADVDAYHHRALLALRAGDAATYRAVCRVLARRSDRLEDNNLMLRLMPGIRLNVDRPLLTCVLGPAALDDYTPLLPRDEKSFLRGRLAVLYRAGQLGRAAAVADQVEKEKNLDALTRFFLAMVRHGQGRKEDARKWLDKGRRALEKDPVGLIRKAPLRDERPPDWAGRLEGSLLRAEAERLILGSPAQVLVK